MIKCPICETQNVQLLIGFLNGLKCYKCKECTLLFVNPMNSKTEINNYYHGFNFGKPGKSNFKKQIDAIKKDVLKIMEFTKLNKKKDLQIFDCGGGVGLYANAFSDYGTVTLLDIDNQACTFASEMFGNKFKIINQDIDLIEKPEKLYDLIFCNQVIEHQIDPISFLIKLKSFLSMDGILIITTPNQKSKEYFFRPFWVIYYLNIVEHKSIFPKFLKFMITPWICCDPPRHLFSFNNKSLSILLKNDFNILNLFNEYSDEQFFSPKTLYDFKISKIKHIARNSITLFSYFGIKFLKILDINKAWGNNLVAIAKKI